MIDITPGIMYATVHIQFYIVVYDYLSIVHLIIILALIKNYIVAN